MAEQKPMQNAFARAVFSFLVTAVAASAASPARSMIYDQASISSYERDVVSLSHEVRQARSLMRVCAGRKEQEG